MKDDLISRAALIAALEGFRVFLGDIVFGWVVDRIIELVKQQPGVEVAPNENL